MNPNELETFTLDWARQAAEHGRNGNQLRLQQNENYWRRMMLAHVPEQGRREALALVRRAEYQRCIEEAA
jgi:hypothetical protein